VRAERNKILPNGSVKPAVRGATEVFPRHVAL